MVRSKLAWMPLVALATLCALALFAQAHGPSTAGEGAGYNEMISEFPVLGNSAFRGPAWTDIEFIPCPNADGAPLDGGTGHLGHIEKVRNLQAPDNSLDSFVADSVNFWHFGQDPDSGYENPREIEPPSSPIPTGPPGTTESDPGVVNAGIMLGYDGYFRGKLQAPMYDGPGVDLRVKDVHENLAYCIYGSLNPAGPYMFIDSTFGDGVGTFQAEKDLATYYTAIFDVLYPDDDSPRAEYLLFIASDFDDPTDIAPPPIVVDAGGPYRSNANLVMPVAPTISSTTTYTCVWSAGSATMSAPTSCLAPGIKYANPGMYSATLNVVDANGVHGSDSAIFEVYGPPKPVISIDNGPRTCIDSRMRFYATGSEDADPMAPGIISYQWSWSKLDGTPVGTPSSDIMPPAQLFGQPGTYKVRLTVQDGDAAPFAASATTETTFSSIGDPPCPPTLVPIGSMRFPVGSTATFNAEASDLDGTSMLIFDTDPMPAGATFDPVTGVFTWISDEPLELCGLTITVSDETYLSDSESICIVFYVPTIDSDQDGSFDGSDNCPSLVNTDQKDTDGDGRGDACDTVGPVDPDDDGTGTGGTGTGTTGVGADDDGSAALASGSPGAGWSQSVDSDRDGIADSTDNCVTIQNAAQENLDRDQRGDACDSDQDGDGILQWGADVADLDNCPRAANPDQLDLDGDFIGDACANGEESALIAEADLDADASSSTLPPSGLEKCRLAGCVATLDGDRDTAATDDSHSRTVLGVSLAVAAVALIGVGAVTWTVRRWAK